MDRPAFFARFNEGDAVLYFYEPLDDDGNESAGVFLTNALTGWEPRTTKPLPFSQLEEERDRRGAGEAGPRNLSNPPYNDFAGMAVDEEHELSGAYRTTKRVRRSESQGG